MDFNRDRISFPGFIWADKKRWEKENMPVVCKILGGPYYLWERLFRDGWGRYMIFQVSYIPSCHLRKFIYKALGANVGKRVVFHFKTEIRDPYNVEPFSVVAGVPAKKVNERPRDLKYVFDGSSTRLY